MYNPDCTMCMAQRDYHMRTIYQGADIVLNTCNSNALTHLNRNCPSNDGACSGRAEQISVLNQSSLGHLRP